MWQKYSFPLNHARNFHSFFVLFSNNEFVLIFGISEGEMGKDDHLRLCLMIHRNGAVKTTKAGFSNINQNKLQGETCLLQKVPPNRFLSIQ